MPEDVGAAERMVRQWQDRAAEKARKFEAMRSEVEAIEVTESSRDGAVRVTVGSNGLLQGLELSEGAGNRPMAKLSAEIMRTVRLAQSRIPELMEQAITGTVGADDPAAQHIMGETRKNFPEAPEEEDPAAGRAGTKQAGVQEMSVGEDEPPSAPPRRPQPRRRPDDVDDDDFSSGSFLR